MKHWPEHLVRETQIVCVVLPLGQIDRRHGDIAHSMRVRRARTLVVVQDRATPTEPDAPGLSQRCPEGNGQTARVSLVFQVGHSIGNDNQPAHIYTTLSQGRLSRWAPLISPTME